MVQTNPKNIINQRYEILRVVGKGRMGITYEARDLENRSHIALKVIYLQHLTDAKQLELLEREVAVLKKLNHPNIPSYLDYFEVDSTTDRVFYIVQQLALGKNLAQWVKYGWRVTEKEVQEIAAQILDILIYLHSFSPPIIHRDIKPHNLICSQDSKMFLVDFGAVQNAYYTTFMGGNTTVGTFGYMPLEQASGKAVPASDLYSLGVTLLYLLTHRSPDELSNGLTFDVRSHIQLSEEFTEWLEKILEPDVEKRFSSAQEALRVLKNPQLVREERLSKVRWSAWLGLGTAAMTGITFFHSYKGAILSNLGFPAPVEVCQQERVTIEYLRSGGKLSPSEANQCLFLAWAMWEMEKINKDLAKDILEVLIAYGANVNLKHRDGYTLLHWAIYKGNTDLLEVLIAQGADVNAKNKDSSTPLHMAASRGDKDLLEVLITHGADVNVKDKDGFTPLHVAASRGDKNLLEVLIAHGADVNVKDKDGFTPLHWAAKKGLFFWLQKHGGK